MTLPELHGLQIASCGAVLYLDLVYLSRRRHDHPECS